MSTRHQHSLPKGYRLLWYEIDCVLGQGGFGITYLARDTNLDQPVAIKEFLPAELAVRAQDSHVHPLTDGHVDTYGWGLARFLTEARTLAKFRHPNIVRVLSVFEANNTAYMVMEYESGRGLDDALKFRRIEGEAALRALLMPLLDGLQKVHEQGFIHRDIKPQNVYLRADGTPVLIDFGSARQALGAETRTLTALVSPGYAPLEQYNASRDNDRQGPWTDIYALGATLYQVVTGEGPVDAMLRVSGVLEGEDPLVPAVQAAAGRYSDAFLRAVDAALALQPQQRPRDIGAWRAMFDDNPPLLGDEARAAPTLVRSQTLVTAALGPEEEQTLLPAVTGAGPATTAGDAATAAPTRFAEEAADAATRVATEAVGGSPAASLPPAARRGRRSVLIAAVTVVALAAGATYWLTRPGQLAPPAGVSTAAKSTPVAIGMPPSDQQVAATVETGKRPGQPATESRAKNQSEQAAADIRAKKRAEQAAAEVEAAEQAKQEAAQAEANKRAAAERVARMLADAEQDLLAGRLTEPAGANALYRYRFVLGLDPGNAQARQGVQRVASALVHAAADARTAGRLDEAGKLLTQARSLDSSDPAIAAERARIEDARRVQAARAQAAREKAARAQRLTALLDEADRDIAALRLTSPPGDNAMERLRAVLAEDPGNARATAGLERVVESYVSLADDARVKGELDKAAGYLDRAATVQPHSEALAAARAALAGAQKAVAAPPAPAAAAPPAATPRAPVAAPVPAVYRVAILQPHCYGSCQFMGNPRRALAVHSRSMALLPDVRVVWSWYAPGGRPAGDQGALWSGSELQTSRLPALATALSADVLVTFSYTARRPGVGVDTVLYDTVSGRMLHREIQRFDLKHDGYRVNELIKQVFDDLRALRAPTTGG